MQYPISLILIVAILLNSLPETASFSVPSADANHKPLKLFSNKQDSTYYTYKSMKRMEIPALLYSICSNTACKIFRRRPQTVAPTVSPSSTSEQQRRPMAIVTGSNTGVGYQTAKSLVVDHGYQVIIASRSTEKGMQACGSINELNANKGGGMAIWEGPLDLSDLESVRSFAERIQNNYNNTTIDLLINNAGVNSVGASGAATDNLDIVFTTNFLGHFLLTNLLLDRCRRVINLSSVMHHFPVYSKQDELGDIESTSFWKDKALAEKEKTDTKTKRKTYGPSKLAALLFTSELQRRYGDRMLSIAVNPGAVYSDIWRNYSKVKQKLFRLLYLTPQQGCQTSVAAAVLDWKDLLQEDPNKTLYLQPYRLPPSGKNQKSPFPMFEMLGPYKGFQVTTPRLPKDGGVKASQALFEVCEELTQCRFPQ